MHKKFVFIFIFTSLFFTLNAQPDSSQQQLNNDRFLKVNYDNDFFSATDHYYTQGIRIELTAPFLRHSPVSKLLIPLHHALNYYALGIEQDGFTPLHIDHIGIYYNERPYAGILFLSHNLISINSEHAQRLTTQLDIGVIGPAAGGFEEQTAIHKSTKGVLPSGWEYQVANDVVLNYSLEYEKGLLTRKYFEFMGFADARLGTLYDDASVGLHLRLGLMNGYLKNEGVTKNNSGNKFQCYVFAKAKIKGVGYNATMEGGMFNKSSVYTIPPADIERIVGMAYTGIVLAYKRISIEYTKAYISPEFNAGLKHGWGHCNLTVCF